ncbi:NADPH:quinone reductase-like Zn-dependent oxidoreductase [Actinocorallia herbida]|uniref:NADPH:quinone reductase-like Zn-dependent oxidoreductase n=1 Tax=Actinocorallia herbida TaxID=58109 RepID=A0A3N1CZA8_9ACTN|nr:NADP-dependent oxidoreductase [Actinocorallia herbida]ROO86615.1 NADPH:quinone reductase-like Zn-dependent oxidoreductase [Actinocorallia herbida]
MKAVRFHGYGDADVLVHEEADRPSPGPGQVLLRVAATSFNPVDAQIRAGLLQQAYPLALPHIPGIDAAGTVEELGEDVTGWAEGAAVLAFLPLGGPGASAEFVLVPAGLLTAAPTGIPLADAAALPAPGLTAWQALYEHASLVPGQTVLINGAGGAVGGYAVQLAARAGATVTATAGPASAARLTAFGAAHLVDYTATPVAESADRYDVVLNLVPTGPDQSVGLTGLVADDGVLVSATTPAPEDAARGVRAVRMFARSDAAQLAALVAKVDAGELTVDVAARRPLADLPALHTEYAEGTRLGRTVITVP